MLGAFWVCFHAQVESPEVGLPEIFQHRDENIYSEVMRGYLSCSGDGNEVKRLFFLLVACYRRNIFFFLVLVPGSV